MSQMGLFVIKFTSPPFPKAACMPVKVCVYPLEARILHACLGGVTEVKKIHVASCKESC